VASLLLALAALLALPLQPAVLALPAGLLFALSQAGLGGLLLSVGWRFICLQRSLGAGAVGQSEARR
jgi:hypothetical protein